MGYRVTDTENAELLAHNVGNDSPEFGLLDE